MGDYSSRLVRNKEWQKKRNAIFDKEANITSGTGTKRTRRGIGSLGHQPNRERRREKERRELKKGVVGV